MAKVITATIRAKDGCQLTEGVVKTMNRYDGKYDNIVRGPVLGRVGKNPDGDYYDWVQVSGKHLTIARWESFGLIVTGIKLIRR